jgi:hypothetical protein
MTFNIKNIIIKIISTNIGVFSISIVILADQAC